MNEIKKILMERDGITGAEANAIISEAKEELDIYLAEGDMDSAMEICRDYFGLEEDYLLDLIGWN